MTSVDLAFVILAGIVFVIYIQYIESKISEALIHNEIIHEDFMTIINEKKY